MLLFINACVRENSRTLRIAKVFLKDKEHVELKLDEMNLLPLNIMWWMKWMISRLISHLRKSY